ncbi:hypothetical protein KXD93_04855 [Mucilaginibacter sp. BJC16-A38]|uniref:hypothetical protein n=1 Tax=Mucilaginibacter phenanthrenivorans TaxID=1234842 RepID=UPI002158232B|nr:hypothetical protein [Mucilaginibacter phenanthrenivorans]MCR8556956.1 hypothetical protein [Mucilaginibacter phenanthrenivorans]
MKKLQQTNNILLHLLDELPETEGASLRAELLLLYGTLVSQLEEADATGKSYEAVAGQIRAKASVHKRKLVSRMKEEA